MIVLNLGNHIVLPRVSEYVRVLSNRRDLGIAEDRDSVVKI